MSTRDETRDYYERNADVYDAKSTKRVYKESYSHDRCVATIRQGAGTQFDPDLVDAWLAVEAKFGEIARHYMSLPEDKQLAAE